MYPSLQFCMDIGQLKQVMAEYTQEDDELEMSLEDNQESEDTDE